MGVDMSDKLINRKARLWDKSFCNKYIKIILKLAEWFTGLENLRPAKKIKDVNHDTCFAKKIHRDPDHLENNCGYKRNWGDAAVMSPYFEVLRKESDDGASFRIICPTFLRRPVEIYTEDPDAWGGY